MEGNARAVKYSKNYLRFSNSSCFKTQINSQLETFQIPHKGNCADVTTNRTLKGTANIGMSNPFRSKLHFKDVSNQKEQRNNKTNLRLTWPQQSRKSEKVSINLAFQDSRLSSKRRLDDSPRPVSGLFPRSSGRIPSLPPSSRLRQGAIAADELALWPLSCPSDLRDHNELDCGNPSFARNEGSRVSGRLLSSLARQDRTGLADQGSCGVARISRLEGESREMYLKPLSGIGVPGNTLEHSRRPHEPSSQESPEDYRFNNGNGSKGALYTEADSVLTGSFKFRQLRNPQGASSLPSPSKIFCPVSATQASTEASNYAAGRAGVKMVANCHDKILPLTQGTNNQLPNDGCSRHRVGSPARRISHIRVMDREPKTMALKQKGDVCGICCDRASSSPPSGCPHSITDGQSYPGGLHSEGGRYKIDGITGLDLPNPPNCRQTGNNPVSSLPSRQVQWNRRPVITKEAPSGVASSTRGNKRDFCKVGCPRRRPFCVRKFGRSQLLCFSRLQRSIRLLHRRLHSSMALQVSLGLSSAQPHAESSRTSEQMPRTVLNSSPEMGSDILDVGLVQQEQGATRNHSGLGECINRHNNEPASTTGRTAHTSGVEDWVWEDLVRDWSAQEKELLR